MVDLEILETDLTKKENGWYEVNIIFNKDYEMTVFVKPDLIVSQYDPIQEAKRLASYSTSTADPLNYPQ